MATPAVIRAIAIGPQCSTKVRSCGQGHPVEGTDIFQGLGECCHPVTQVCVQIRQQSTLVAVGVVTVGTDQEHLTLDPELLLGSDDIGHPFKLAAQAGVREGDAQVGRLFDDRQVLLVGLEPIDRGVGQVPGQDVVRGLSLGDPGLVKGSETDP